MDLDTHKLESTINLSYPHQIRNHHIAEEIPIIIINHRQEEIFTKIKDLHIVNITHTKGEKTPTQTKDFLDHTIIKTLDQDFKTKVIILTTLGLCFQTMVLKH